MRKIIIPIFLIFTFLCTSAIAEVIIVTHTVRQSFGGSQSPDDARISAIAKAKTEALEKAGTYIESLTVVQDSKVEKDEILALAAGVLQAEVISQKNYLTKDAFGIEITVNVVVDNSVLEVRVKKLLQDRTHLAQLINTHRREKELLQRLTYLEEENRQLTAEKLDARLSKSKEEKPKQMAEKHNTSQLKREFQKTSRDLTAIHWIKKALSLWDGGKYTDSKMAIKYLNNGIKLQPDYADAYIIRGFTYYMMLGLYQRAVKDFNEAIRLKPDNGLAYQVRGIAYSKLGQYQHAITDFTEVIRLKPTDDIAFEARGIAYGNLGRYDRAQDDFNETIRLKPNDAGAFKNRGLASCKLGRYQSAQDDFNEAIRLKPDDAGAYYNMACLFAIQKKASLACNWLRLAIERGFDQWDYIKEDKDFENIRNESCFLDLHKELKK